MGFAQVSVSHEVSPLIKLVGRGDTTVVDAYLSPILQRYVAQVEREMAVSSPPPRAGEGRERSSPGGGKSRTQAQVASPAPTLPRTRGREQAAASGDARLMFMMSSGG